MPIEARATTFGPEGAEYTDIGFDRPIQATFRAQLRTAVEWAVLVGVKIAIVAAFLWLAFGLVLGDYAQTRIGARQGSAAFQYLQKAEEAARQKATPKSAEKP